MIKIITYARQDYCNECNTNRGIECYDSFNRSINYNTLVDMHCSGKEIMSKLNNRELSHMKCRRCGYVYCIDWTQEIPTPLRAFVYVDNFLYNNFNKTK